MAAVVIAVFLNSLSRRCSIRQRAILNEMVRRFCIHMIRNNQRNYDIDILKSIQFENTLYPAMITKLMTNTTHAQNAIQMPV